MKILLSDIAVIHRQRTELDPKHIKDIAQSIEELTPSLPETGGLIHAIVVRDPYDYEVADCKGASYVLMVGGCRYAAHMVLQRTEIEAVHIKDLDPISAEIAELEENLRRKNISWQDEDRARVRIVELRKKADPSKTVKEIAEEIGKDYTQIYRAMQLVEAAKEDPTLLQATSRQSARRAHVRKEDVKKRLANVETSKTTDLRSKLICADAVQYAKTIPGHSVQMIFTDLPYGIDYFENAAGSKNSAGKFDDDTEKMKAFVEALVPEMVRIVKPSGWIVLFMSYEWHGWLQDLLSNACTKHAAYRSQAEPTLCLRGLHSEEDETCNFLTPELPPWIWDRGSVGSFGHWPELHAANRYEMLIVTNGGKATLAHKPVENVLRYAAISGPRKHAHEKPLALCRELISRCTVPGELVVDFCFGSGAHLAAAAASGRSFFGCDNNPANLDGAIAYVSEHYHGGLSKV